MRRREPGGPEEREPRREVPLAAAETDAVLREGLRRPRDPHPLAQAPPELGLPAQVGRDLAPRAVLVLLRGPGPQHRGPVLAVGVEEPGEVAGRGEPPARAGAGRVTHDAEVGAQRRAPVLARAGVDHLEQRPDEAFGPPWVVVGVAPRAGHELGGRGELDAGAHPVLPQGGAEAVREALREPALHAPGRHGDHVRGEGVLRGRGEDVGQRLRQPVRALGAVHVEGHPAPLPVVSNPATGTLDAPPDSVVRTPGPRRKARRARPRGQVRPGRDGSPATHGRRSSSTRSTAAGSSSAPPPDPAPTRSPSRPSTS